MNCRVGNAASVFQRLRPIWISCVVSTATLYNSIVMPVASYASETWKMIARIEHKLNQRCIMFEENSNSYIQRPHYKRGNLALGQLQKAVRHCIVTERRFCMAGLVIYYAYQIIERRKRRQYPGVTQADGRRKAGRPKKTWRRTFQQNVQIVDFKWEEGAYVAKERAKWRQAAARCVQMHGRN